LISGREIFNLFNHAQFGLPGGDVSSPSQFGKIGFTVNNPGSFSSG
jgi:hypothetical protein